MTHDLLSDRPLPLPLSTVLTRLRRPPIPAVIIGVGISMLIIVVMTVRWFLSPHSVDPDRVDAVVVLAGGRGERLDRALELMAKPVSDTLVLSVGNGMWSDSEAITQACGDDVQFEVICFAPVPDSTKGEALTFQQLAGEHGWESIALVTSEYHLHRAALRFSRCFDGEILPVAAPAETGLGLLTHEWLGTLQARTLDRGCD